MFRNLFKRSSSEEKASDKESQDSQVNAYMEVFQDLVNSSLAKLGVDEKCNISKNENWGQQDEENHNNLLSDLGYDELFDRVVLEELQHHKKNASNLTRTDFAQNFYSNFHHIKISQFVPEPIQLRNDKLLSAYKGIIECINRIQGWLDDEFLRGKIESDYRNSGGHITTIYQCYTPFCAVSLGSSSGGHFNIIYSIDYRIKEIIGRDFANTLIRRIYEFTPGEMESFVDFGSLYGDCIAIYDEVLESAKTEEHHQFTIANRFEYDSIEDLISKLEFKDNSDQDSKNE